MNKCAQLVQAAYDQYDAFKNNGPWGLPYGMDMVSVLSAKPAGFFSELEPFGYICRNGDTYYIIFRGTVSHHDWLTNGDLSQVDHPLGGRVHGGSWKLYLQMRGAIVSILRNNPSAKIFVGGHSLGCWMAAYAGLDLSGLSPCVRLWAPPRTGNVEFSVIYNAAVPDTESIINLDDIVTGMPLAVNDDTFYTHVGKFNVFSFNTESTTGNHAFEFYAKMAEA